MGIKVSSIEGNVDLGAIGPISDLWSWFELLKFTEKEVWIVLGAWRLKGDTGLVCLLKWRGDGLKGACWSININSLLIGYSSGGVSMGDG